MNTCIKRSTWLAAFVICAVSILSCSKEKNPEGDNKIPENIRRANEFIAAYMYDGYLWNGAIPGTIDPQQEEDPFVMLDKMIYKELDRWTYVTDDAAAAMNDFQGISTTFGYSLALYRFPNSSDLYAVIRYVTAGSPAEKAGLKRGDILLTLGGGNIQEKNYLDLIYGKTITIGLGMVQDNVISPSGKTYTITSVEMYEDPVNTYTIIDPAGAKVGYIAYTGYLKESHAKLDEVFTYFKNNGVKEVVLDLRYNPGGNAETPPYLASFLAPAAKVTAGSVFLKEVWNTKYMEYYRQKGEDMNVYFNKNNVANLNLSRVFVLTTGNTASASEATISGLMPYMQVIKIGAATHGKYCGAALLLPVIDNKGTLDPVIKNWLLSMVIYRFVNKDGFTDFKDGIAPDYKVEDDLFVAYPFGDTRDPLLAKALSIITGVEQTAGKTRATTLQAGRDYIPLPELTDKLRKDYGNTKLIFWEPNK